MTAAASKRRQVLVDNAIWLVISLMLAMVVWVTAELDTNPFEVKSLEGRVPIQVLTDPDTMITNQPTSAAFVIVRAQRSTLQELDAEDIEIYADLRGVDELGQRRVPLAWRVKADAAAAVMTISPTHINVTLDLREERFVPLKVMITQPAPASVDATVSVLDTNQVLVSGPADVVAAVDEAQVQLDLSQQRESVTLEVEPQPITEDSEGVASQINGLTLQPAVVAVNVTVKARSDVREVRVTPNLIGEPPDGYTLTPNFSYSPETVFVSGTPDILERLPGTLFTTPIDLGAYTGDFEIRVPVDLPDDNLVLITGQRITVTVGIAPIQTSRQIERIPVETIGLAEGFEVVLSPSEVSVLVNGPQPIVSSLEPEDIRVVVDLSSQTTPGVIQLSPAASVRSGQIEDDNLSVLPATIDAELHFAGEATPP